MPSHTLSISSTKGCSKPFFSRILPLLILLLSWLFYTWALGERSLWVDEYVTTNMVRGSVVDAALSAAKDVHPPFYFVLLNLWTQTAGSTDFAFRLMSAMASLLAVAIMLPLSRSLWPVTSMNWRFAAMFALACAPAMVLFGRMSRYYSLVLLLGMLSTWALMTALNSRRWSWVLYCLVSVTMLYTFMPSIVLMAAHAVPALTSRRRYTWLGAVALILALFSPWLAVVAIGQISMVQSFLVTPFARSLSGLILGMGASVYTFSVGETLFPWSPVAIVSLLSVALAVGAALLRGGWHARRLALMLAVGITGIAFLVNFLAVGTPFLNVPVRGLFLLPFAVLLVLMGLQQIKRMPVRYSAAGAILLTWAISLLNGYAGAQFMNPIYLTPSKEAATWVSSHVQPGDLVIADWEAAFDRYYTSALSRQAQYIDSMNTDTVRAAIIAGAPARVWRVSLGRDSKQIESLAETDKVIADAYRFGHSDCLAPIDSLYRRFKSLALQRESYDCRLVVKRFDRVMP
jgi:hypothetical protein